MYVRVQATVEGIAVTNAGDGQASLQIAVLAPHDRAITQSMESIGERGAAGLGERKKEDSKCAPLALTADQDGGQASNGVALTAWVGIGT